MSVNVALSVDRCHRTVGVGAPSAAATKETGAPGLTVWSAGSVVTAGVSSTRTVTVWTASVGPPLEAVSTTA